MWLNRLPNYFLKTKTTYISQRAWKHCMKHPEEEYKQKRIPHPDLLCHPLEIIVLNIWYVLPRYALLCIHTDKSVLICVCVGGRVGEMVGFLKLKMLTLFLWVLVFLSVKTHPSNLIRDSPGGSYRPHGWCRGLSWNRIRGLPVSSLDKPL